MSINRRAMQLATIGVAIALVATVTLVVTNLTADEGAGADLLSGSEPLPEGSDLEGRPGAEQSAIDLADFLGAVTLENGDPCPKDRLTVSWEAPTEDYEVGAHYTPVGPEPGANTVSANGIVTCSGSTYSYTGFAARWTGERWETDLTPGFFADDVDGVNGEDGEQTSGSRPDAPAGSDDITARDLTADDLTAEEFADLLDQYTTDDDRTDDRREPNPDPAAGPSEEGDDRTGEADDDEETPRSGLVDEITALEVDDDWEGLWDVEPEELAEYEPQQICSPKPKPGTEGFKDLVLAGYPDTGDFGIGRDCGFSPDGTSTSEHYEGRAWDWKVLVDDPQDAKAASEIIGWLLATDEDGNEYAMARRLGVMYMIFNNSMWRSYRAEDGWLGYTGANPHTDHVHISFDRSGGLGETSFWDAEGLPELAKGGFGPVGYLPDAGGSSSGAPGGFFGGTPPSSNRAQGGGASRIPVVPTPNRGATGGGGNNGGGGVIGGGADPGGGIPAPTAPGLPSIPLPQLPGVPLPDIPAPTVPQVPGLPLCPPGTPLLPLPLDCILRGVLGGGS